MLCWDIIKRTGANALKEVVKVVQRYAQCRVQTLKMIDSLAMGITLGEIEEKNLVDRSYNIVNGISW